MSPAGLAERQIAELIEDHEVGVGEAMGHLVRFTSGLLKIRGVH